MEQSPWRIVRVNSRSPRAGQSHRRAQSAFQAACESNIAALALHEAARSGEPESAVPGVMAARRLVPHGGFEYPRQVVLGDSRAVVLDDDLDFLFVPLNPCRRQPSWVAPRPGQGLRAPPRQRDHRERRCFRARQGDAEASRADGHAFRRVLGRSFVPSPGHGRNPRLVAGFSGVEMYAQGAADCKNVCLPIEGKSMNAVERALGRRVRRSSHCAVFAKREGLLKRLFRQQPMLAPMARCEHQCCRGGTGGRRGSRTIAGSGFCFCGSPWAATGG